MSPAGVPGAETPDAGKDGVDGDPCPRFSPVCFVLVKQTAHYTIAKTHFVTACA